MNVLDFLHIPSTITGRQPCCYHSALLQTALGVTIKIEKLCHFEILEGTTHTEAISSTRFLMYQIRTPNVFVSVFNFH